jgi:hypothetical protein
VKAEIREIAGAWCIVDARGLIIRAVLVEAGAEQLVWVAGSGSLVRAVAA